MNYYKRHLGDYAKKAGRLSMLQHGAYTLLLDSCYDRERFPTEEEAIEWLWASSSEEIDAVKFILCRFFTKCEDGTYFQQRVSDEIAAYHSIADTNKRIAKEREEARRSTKRVQESTKREQFVNEPPPPINQEPRTINQEPLKRVVADKPQPTPKLSDVEWMDSLRTHYPHIDIEQESRKMDAWLSTRRGKQKTRRFVVNWLNRIDAPMQATVSTLPAEYAF